MESNWAEETLAPSITVEELDGLVQDYVKMREEYEAAKKVATDAYNVKEAAEGRVREALKTLGKKSYKVEGLGTFTRVMKEVVTVPKDLDKKRMLFDWIKERYGDDVLDSMRSINHQSLNSFYNQEVEKASGDPTFAIPGLDSPTSVESVSFRK
jgi:hypothetical protein